CRFATCPTRRSPDLVNATTDGVVRPPSSLAMTLGSPPSITATTELVVPKSIPMIFPMTNCPLLSYKCFEISKLQYNSSSIIRVESVAVKLFRCFLFLQVAGNEEKNRCPTPSKPGKGIDPSQRAA